MRDKTIGILGGMGPEATVYLFELIVKMTDADKDQEHIPIIIYNNPKIPHRTCAILGGGPSPLPFLIKGAKFLEKAGADFIVMPCVTAHYFYSEIIKKIKIPFLHLIEETYNYVKKEFPTIKRLGLLATSGTIKTNLFQEYFEKGGIEIIIPDEKEQNKVMEAIYCSNGIKAGYKNGLPKNLLMEAAENLISKKRCEGIIAGCTEVPLALKREDFRVPFINPLEIIARKSILKAGYRVRE
ncbi:amino acid racemase [Candidatus Aminicenantes bacterium AC-335-B20]|jgi:aspartate racemase|nr:amino acid racemase [SCandidatus Aminicenantes bacterium Aminicenantia_JdfR_composite]MCP2597120.1 amino acid racemase [Candidatus Aminicenantes bacterium AC-335-G13]MCP2598245.1 amino acid racemase [Candidatus Aminicenantes bacterium AC-335-L06]MCP2598877.1 amino acid racemase [Candidatus Aminicenantes bacterium AC-335-B20]MCP2618675.1 amino acid racemase [Candidatus Aminicenantes bacterium AC-335-A11]